MCVRVWLIHFAVGQKLTQHCKAIIFQLKKKLYKKTMEDIGLYGRINYCFSISLYFLFLIKPCNKYGMLKGRKILFSLYL